MTSLNKTYTILRDPSNLIYFITVQNSKSHKKTNFLTEIIQYFDYYDFVLKISQPLLTTMLEYFSSHNTAMHNITTEKFQQKHIQTQPQPQTGCCPQCYSNSVATQDLTNLRLKSRRQQKKRGISTTFLKIIVIRDDSQTSC